MPSPFSIASNRPFSLIVRVMKIAQAMVVCSRGGRVQAMVIRHVMQDKTSISCQLIEKLIWPSLSMLVIEVESSCIYLYIYNSMQVKCTARHILRMCCRNCVAKAVVISKLTITSHRSTSQRRPTSIRTSSQKHPKR